MFIAVQRRQLECTERINWQDNYELSVFKVGTRANAWVGEVQIYTYALLSTFRTMSSSW